MIEQYVGGTGFGAEFLYREVPPGVQWDDPENRIIMASGPLGGTTVSGAGAFALVTKGPMTNLAITSQAIGFLGRLPQVLRLRRRGHPGPGAPLGLPAHRRRHGCPARRCPDPGQGYLGDGGRHPAGPRGDAADERLRHRAGGRSQGPLRRRRRRQGPCLFEERLRGGDGGQKAQGRRGGPRPSSRSRLRQGALSREGQRPRRARQGVPAGPLQLGNGRRILRPLQGGEPPGAQPSPPTSSPSTKA